MYLIIVIITLEVTMYDKFIQWALNNITIVAIVLISSILMALPQIKEGCKSIYNLFRLFLREKPFVSEYADEVITFEEKLISYDFDIVKINAITHKLGVFSEYEWLNKKYSRYKKCTQSLMHVDTPQGKKIFDVFLIMKGSIKKEIYFEITDFYDGAIVHNCNNTSEYAKKMINDIYSR